MADWRCRIFLSRDRNPLTGEQSARRGSVFTDFLLGSCQLQLTPRLCLSFRRQRHLCGCSRLFRTVPGGIVFGMPLLPRKRGGRGSGTGWRSHGDQSASAAHANEGDTRRKASLKDRPEEGRLLRQGAPLLAKGRAHVSECRQKPLALVSSAGEEPNQRWRLG